jgi:hypothetical protein
MPVAMRDSRKKRLGTADGGNDTRTPRQRVRFESEISVVMIADDDFWGWSMLAAVKCVGGSCVVSADDGRGDFGETVLRERKEAEYVVIGR